jgi:integrase
VSGLCRRASIARLWHEAFRLAGCPGRIPHDFRRTAVRNLIPAGVPQKTAMLLTRHKTRPVFDRYDIVNEDDRPRPRLQGESKGTRFAEPH